MVVVYIYVIICFALIFLNQMPNCITCRLKLAVVAVVIIIIRTIGTQVSQPTHQESNNNSKNVEVTYGKL